MHFYVCITWKKFLTFTGHEEVWHGFVDIVFASHENVEPETIATTVKYSEDDSEFTTPVKKNKLEG